MQFKAKSKADPNVIRLKDGESVTGVFRGEPVEYYQHRTPDGQYVQAVQGEMMNGKKPQFRFRLNLCVRGENGGFEAKVFENGWKVYEQLAALQESGYDLETTVIRLSRKGSTVSDTVYTALPVPNVVLSNDNLASLGAVELKDLTPAFATPSQPLKQPNPVHTESDVPF